MLELKFIDLSLLWIIIKYNYDLIVLTSEHDKVLGQEIEQSCLGPATVFLQRHIS